MASGVNTVFTRLPFRSISYRLPSSLFAKTMPLTSTAGAFTHHSNANGWSEVQVSTPWLLYEHEFVLVLRNCQLKVRSGLSEVMKYFCPYAGLVASRSGGQIVASLQ